MTDRTRETIEAPDRNSVKLLRFRIFHQPIEFWPPLFGSAPPSIRVLVDDFCFPLLSPNTQRLELRLNVLAVLLCRHSGVENQAHRLIPAAN